MKTFVTTVAASMLLATTAHAYGPPALAHHHHIGLQVGMWNQSTSTRTETTVGGVTSTVDDIGGMGGVSYSYWLYEGFAVGVSLSGMMTDTKFDVGNGSVDGETGTLTRVMVGAKTYFPRSTFGTRFRPFVSAAIGPVVGQQSEANIGPGVVAESRSESAVSAQLGLGSDFRIGSRFMTTAMAGYNLMSDFDRAIGGSRNYSGPEFSFGFGVILGKM